MMMTMMTELVQGHPCSGKDCKDCETCIFDKDLFIDKVQPNKKEEIMNCKICNLCTNLEKTFDHSETNRFDASCRAVPYDDAWGKTRNRRIGFNLSVAQDIVCPNWCPLNKPSACMALPSPNQVSTSSTSKISKHVSLLTYTEKRELMKELPRRIEWNNIEVGKTYVIPKIMSQSRKVVRVSSKTDSICICHEINESTKSEYSSTCNIYPSDLDAVFITELHEF